jgi:SAM-dependent methyltransferase
VKSDYLDLAVDEAEGSGAALFTRHLHWGLWNVRPQTLDQSSLLEGMTRLDDFVLDRLNLDSSTTIVDIGCGFGGTLKRVHERNARVGLLGITDDCRQLSLGQSRVWSALCADGVQIPLASGSVDRVICVESVFHYSSRSDFLREVARVLRPGGLLVLTDFVSSIRSRRVGTALFAPHRLKPTNPLFGQVDVSATRADYRRLAAKHCLAVDDDVDITVRVAPTYRHVDVLWRAQLSTRKRLALWELYWLCRVGLLRYRVLTIRRLGAPD